AGLLGAAVATGTFHLLRNVFVWWKVRRDARWLNFAAVAICSILIWGGAVLICLGMKRALSAPPLVAMTAGLAVCSVATLAYVRSPALSSSDRELLRQLFHGREARLLEKLGVLPRLKHA
ncbi:MAG TPA: hypothetical protein VI195_08970, partial [Steroidobacteraceae bacterium]